MNYKTYVALQGLLNHLRSINDPEILADLRQLDAWSDETTEVIEY